MKSITIKTVAGKTFVLTPVRMARMPSHNSSDWLKFHGQHVPGTSLPEFEQERIQRFMNLHNTEALTDGEQNYTFAGGMLAMCNPDAI